MKELGMSLEEIKRVLEKEDIDLIETILSEKNELIHLQMRALRAQHDAVEHATPSIERYRRSPEEGVVVLEYRLRHCRRAREQPLFALSDGVLPLRGTRGRGAAAPLFFHARSLTTSPLKRNSIYATPEYMEYNDKDRYSSNSNLY